MIGITLTADQICNAPIEVRRWIEHEVIAGLRLAPQARASSPPRIARPAICSEDEMAAIFGRLRGMPVALSVLFEFRLPGINFGDPPVKSFRLMDILHNSKLQGIEQVMTGLDAISKALADLRGDPGVCFCDFDSEGHCFLAPETQASIAKLWHDIVVQQEPPADTRREPMLRSAG
ncbi:hypothetical protein AYJ54_32175 [Bradyrhizobium centrolobii]|uniref:Uncharacterized protein n=1 Tax=Bradyrhizobium centrolobii TaxID=1505087 RepID=A0A176Y8U5_9BRAD|nr:hypothetical protein [Bradyrhizobium centrolobii]OAE99942.1 hypothetical protein AYJ54_32175 [Bradyrhizobium centrolobii]